MRHNNIIIITRHK